MKKLIIALILAAMTLAGCGTRETLTTWKVCGKITAEWNTFIVYYDESTKVMYAACGSGLTPLLNADGTPMLWEEE